MSSTKSLNSLAFVCLSFLCAVTTCALVEATGEGGEIRLEKENYVSVFVLAGIIPPSVFYFLNTWFIPAESDTGVLTTFRTLRIMLGLEIVAMICGLLGFFAVVWVGPESTATLAAIMFCLSLAKYGLWFACLTMLAGGIIGIAIDLFVVATRIRLRKARCR